MAKALWSLWTATLLVACFITPAPADVCRSSRYRSTWRCSGVNRCCFDYEGCCYNYAAAYWYAWFLISLGVFVCVCCCLGCAGVWGYRRRRVVTLQYSAPNAGTSYQTYEHVPQSQYQPYTPPKEAPPPPYSPPPPPA